MQLVDPDGRATIHEPSYSAGQQSDSTQQNGGVSPRKVPDTVIGSAPPNDGFEWHPSIQGVSPDETKWTRGSPLSTGPMKPFLGFEQGSEKLNDNITLKNSYLKAGIDKDTQKGNLGVGIAGVEKGIEGRGTFINILNVFKADILGKYNGMNGEASFGVKGFSTMNAKASAKLATFGTGLAVSLFGYGICGTIDFNLGSVGAGIEIGATTSIELDFFIGAKIKVQLENLNN